MIKISNVCLKAHTDDYSIFHNLTIDIMENEFIMIVGRNGVGKSSFLRLINGEIKNFTGCATVDGHSVKSMHSSQRKKLFSYVTQYPDSNTVSDMTVFENLNLAYMQGKRRGMRLYNTKERRSFFMEKLKELDIGLERKLNQFVATLSGGQRQLLSVVMSLLSESKILLMDEITSALDPKTSDNVMKLTRKILRGKTVLMITHDMHHAIEYGDRLIILNDGSVMHQFKEKEKSSLKPLELIKLLGEG
ncbi:Putative ABC transporter ATP-binding protein [Candidatus Fokinia solitaria]|uniref:ABC transporter ATP-binding protein n=1 Tax=Candidatus Fokinia solitaria TaxID=1802984 RepID=A0A2U8BTM7_9RICK|nr:ATP-binding cassette domain-containing protein [Candidatus Fokinia solitaria]AWD33487.1 Putative ABC transporter ATP-binding protein [Candidatus Fokinia solitaria]